jgi:hypothetical protein
VWKFCCSWYREGIIVSVCLYINLLQVPSYRRHTMIWQLLIGFPLFFFFTISNTTTGTLPYCILEILNAIKNWNVLLGSNFVIKITILHNQKESNVCCLLTIAFSLLCVSLWGRNSDLALQQAWSVECLLSMLVCLSEWVIVV